MFQEKRHSVFLKKLKIQLIQLPCDFSFQFQGRCYLFHLLPTHTLTPWPSSDTQAEDAIAPKCCPRPNIGCAVCITSCELSRLFMARKVMHDEKLAFEILPIGQNFDGPYQSNLQVKCLASNASSLCLQSPRNWILLSKGNCLPNWVHRETIVWDHMYDGCPAFEIRQKGRASRGRLGYRCHIYEIFGSSVVQGGEVWGHSIPIEPTNRLGHPHGKALNPYVAASFGAGRIHITNDCNQWNEMEYLHMLLDDTW